MEKLVVASDAALRHQRLAETMDKAQFQIEVNVT